MKRVIATAVVVVAVFVGGMVARAAIATSGTPEIDRANAKITLQGKLAPTKCVGEDGVGYLTYKGSYTGSESQILPDPTDYTLSGLLTVSGIHWTINTKTLRGVLTGTVTLSAAAGAEYVGTLTLISQGLPSATAAVPSRGWIVAKFKPADEGVAPGDDNLLANVEFGLFTSGATGQFGDAAGSGTAGVLDYSVVTNVAPTALDGTC